MQPRLNFWPGCLRAFVLFLLAFASCQTHAFRKIDPGEAADLKPDEGLLLITFDSSSKVISARFGGDGKAFARGVMSNLDAGRNPQLFALREGRYQWDSVRLQGLFGLRYTFDLSDSNDFAFEVKAGAINYAGDLIFRPEMFTRARFHVANRSLRAMDWLYKHHADISSSYTLVYSGSYPDPFPTFYRQAWELAGKPSEFPPSPLPPELDEAPVLSVEQMWDDDRVVSADLNPRGDFVASLIRLENGAFSLDLVDLEAGTAQSLLATVTPITDIGWKDDRTLLAHSIEDHRRVLSVIKIGERDGDLHAVETHSIPSTGIVLDLLPAVPGRVLHQDTDEHGQAVVFSVDIGSPDGMAQLARARTRDRLNRGLDDAIRWFADGSGRLRAAVVQREDQQLLMYGQKGQFSEIQNLSGLNPFVPMALSRDGKRIFGLSDAGRAQRDLVVLDGAQGKVTETLFSKPGTDVVSPIIGPDGEPVGVNYYEDGRLVGEFFDQADHRTMGMLNAAFPDLTVMVVDRSDDASRSLVWVDGSDTPARLFFVDSKVRKAELLEHNSPKLADVRFAQTHRMVVRTRDGLDIEAFVTLPDAEGQRPLVVMPHGGPIGVADRLHFNRDVQFLASLGYAVLRVNYRGSEGFGSAFREAGRNQLGAAIEDDIDTALSQALESFPLDEQRMCVMGTSYGGFSALASAARHPERFRCVISIAGVTDRALFFTASDGGRTAAGRAQLERWLGNPSTDLQQMMEVSPLYRYRDITAPVLLVHGLEDWRVDYEHALRLQRMLSLAGRPPSMITFQNEGHAVGNDDTRMALWHGVAGFLAEHLKPAQARTGSSGSEASTP